LGDLGGEGELPQQGAQPAPTEVMVPGYGVILLATLWAMGMVPLQEGEGGEQIPVNLLWDESVWVPGYGFVNRAEFAARGYVERGEPGTRHGAVIIKYWVNGIMGMGDNGVVEWPIDEMMAVDEPVPPFLVGFLPDQILGGPDHNGPGVVDEPAAVAANEPAAVAANEVDDSSSDSSISSSDSSSSSSDSSSDDDDDDNDNNEIQEPRSYSPPYVALPYLNSPPASPPPTPDYNLPAPDYNPPAPNAPAINPPASPVPPQQLNPQQQLLLEQLQQQVQQLRNSHQFHIDTIFQHREQHSRQIDAQQLRLHEQQQQLLQQQQQIAALMEQLCGHQQQITDCHQRLVQNQQQQYEYGKSFLKIISFKHSCTYRFVLCGCSSNCIM